MNTLQKPEFGNKHHINIATWFDKDVQKAKEDFSERRSYSWEPNKLIGDFSRATCFCICCNQITEITESDLEDPVVFPLLFNNAIHIAEFGNIMEYWCKKCGSHLLLDIEIEESEIGEETDGHFLHIDTIYDIWVVKDWHNV